jgi:hypothetical protein
MALRTDGVTPAPGVSVPLTPPLVVVGEASVLVPEVGDAACVGDGWLTGVGVAGPRSQAAALVSTTALRPNAANLCLRFWCIVVVSFVYFAVRTASISRT